MWGGTNSWGATPIVILMGTLIHVATRYTRVLDAAEVPFIQKYYHTGYCFSKTMILSTQLPQLHLEMDSGPDWILIYTPAFSQEEPL